MAQFCSDLILFVISTQFLFSSSNYIYQNISGTLINNSGFNFSIYSTNLIGIILYGGDLRGNKLLIEIDQINNEKTIYLKMNKLERDEKIKTICECSECSNVVMIFVMHLNDAQINITCNDKSNIIQMITSSNNQDAFLPYPKFKQQSNDTNESFIMMGNIGPYRDHRNTLFQPFDNQLSGCLNKLYYNNKLINFASNGTKFNSSCNEEYKETTCIDGNCTNINVSYKFDDCSISSMNTRFCRNNLSTITPNDKLFYYYKLQKNISAFFRLNWKVIQAKKYCLLEIELKNGTFILFHVNIYGQIVINIKYRQSIIDEKILTKISITNINILLINFHYSNFVIKISNDENIYTFVYKLIDYPISINVGRSKYFNNCQPFFGLIEVKSDYWHSSNSKIEIYKKNEMKSIIISMLITFSVSLILFILLMVFIYIVRTRYRNLRFQRPHVEDQHYQIDKIKNISMPIHNEFDPYEDGDEYGCIRD